MAPIINLILWGLLGIINLVCFIKNKEDRNVIIQYTFVWIMLMMFLIERVI